MLVNYDIIREDNKKKYGTDIGRIGWMLLANRYDDRTHFIFELLQNAEDAYARCQDKNGRREVQFKLTADSLQFSHWGKPFDEKDVRGICGIDESTKDLNSIGRFGIGFKSVYAFTDCPEIHSDEEHFAIDSYVWPRATSKIVLEPGQTTLKFPLRDNDKSARAEIIDGLKKLGSRSLLFLKEIETINWSVEDGPSGLYLRNKPENVPNSVLARKVVIIGQLERQDIIEEIWHIFSCEVSKDDKKAGCVEIAFKLKKKPSKDNDDWTIEPINDSPLIVFFPTVLSTNLGFLVQGPYRTTPSRDNVPSSDSWNLYLVEETAKLLQESLLELRNQGLLNVDAFYSLPLDRDKFVKTRLFAPLFDKVYQSLSTELLLPSYGGVYISANQARLARTQDLRDLFSPSQLTMFLGEKNEVAWLSKEITQDRTPELRRYFMQELKIKEIIPETVLFGLTEPFLKVQTDEWIVQLYEFLNGQPALRRKDRLKDIPLIRLEDGQHVTLSQDGPQRAFLPGAELTDFPTVKRTICGTDSIKSFLTALGLTVPNPVDDVIRNLLPRYKKDSTKTAPPTNYADDIQRILTAFRTDSEEKRRDLVSALRDSSFLAAVDTKLNACYLSQPTQVYRATDRLKDLFSGVLNVLIVDESRDCLKGDNIRRLFEACGVARYLLQIEIKTKFTNDECLEMRRKGGCEDKSGNENIRDYTLRGLRELLETLPKLDKNSAQKKAALLWEALCDLETQHGSSFFTGIYSWSFTRYRSYNFNAAFVRQLNEFAWVPDRDGVLHLPSNVIFTDTGWKENPLLLSKIHFKPPIIDALAREAGIDSAVLYLLKKLGVTSEAELKDILKEGTLEEGSKPSSEPPKIDDETDGGGQSGTGGGQSGTGGGQSGTGGGQSGTPGQAPNRILIDGLGDDEEERAIREKRLPKDDADARQKVVEYEQEEGRQSTPADRYQAGYDVFSVDSKGCKRNIEVKGLQGAWQSDATVTMTGRQFDDARTQEGDWWLYVVENLGTDHPNVIAIHNPARGASRFYLYARHWRDKAETKPPKPLPGPDDGEE